MCIESTAVKWGLPAAAASRIFAAMRAGHSFALLIVRVTLSGIFLYTGFGNVQHVGDTAKQLAELGYPVAHVLAVVAAIAELGGGISILLGALTPLGCIALILFLLPTTYSFHVPGLLAGDARQIIETLKNVAIIGGLVGLMFSGPGRYSIDARVMNGGAKGDK